MPNATVRASARTLPKTTNRRSILAGALAAGATTALPASAAAQSPALSDADRQVLDLWRLRAELRATAEQASEQYWAAIKQLPQWAAPGRKYCQPDGSPSDTDTISDWPKVACLDRLRVNDRGQINARPKPHDLGSEFMQAFLPALQTSDGDEASILQNYAQIFSEVYDRRRLQIAERERLNIDVLGRRSDVAFAAVTKSENEFENYMGKSLLGLAAVLIIAIQNDAEEIEGLNRAALAAIRPQLTGAIADDADRALTGRREEA